MQMTISKRSLITLSFLLIMCVSSLTAFSIGMTNPETNFSDTIQANSVAYPASDLILSDVTNYVAELNATVKSNRTIFLETYGVASFNETIVFHNVGEDSIKYFNYTLPNINTEKLTFIAFYITNESWANIYTANASRSYAFSRYVNYTTYRVPFTPTGANIEIDSTYNIRVLVEFAQPYEVSFEEHEQLLHYQEYLTPLIDNVPIINGTTLVRKQGGDRFEDTRYEITPTNETTVTVYLDAASGTLKWTNITRASFNISQSYEDDFLMNVYLSSVSNTQDVTRLANTMLFKATEAYRKIEIDPYGLVRITEKQTIEFLGPEFPAEDELDTINMFALNALVIVFPQNVTVLNIFDEVGGLNLKYMMNEQQMWERGTYNLRESTFPGHQGLIIFPRTPLYKGDIMCFTIEYKLPLEDVLFKEQGTINYDLKISPYSIINWTIDDLTLDIVLPKGAVYRYHTYNNPDPYQQLHVSYEKKFYFGTLGFKRILNFKATAFSGNDNTPLIINFNYSRMNVWITYLIQILAVGALIAVYLGFRWTRKFTREVSGEVDKEFIPIDEIREFVKQYEEKLGLQDRIRETRAKIAAKKLKTREGKELRFTLEKRLRKIEELLKTAKVKLVEYRGRYKEAVQKVEINERKLYEERRNLIILQKEYRTKKTMTKESYIQLVRERQQTIEKLKNDIDGELVSLRLLTES